MLPIADQTAELKWAEFFCGLKGWPGGVLG